MEFTLEKPEEGLWRILETAPYLNHGIGNLIFRHQGARYPKEKNNFKDYIASCKDNSILPFTAQQFSYDRSRNLFLETVPGGFATSFLRRVIRDCVGDENYKSFIQAYQTGTIIAEKHIDIIGVGEDFNYEDIKKLSSNFPKEYKPEEGTICISANSIRDSLRPKEMIHWNKLGEVSIHLPNGGKYEHSTAEWFESLKDNYGIK